MFIVDIPGYPDYKFHRNGFVISFKYRKPRILKTRVSLKGKGYDYVNLMKDGKYHTEFIHMLNYKLFHKTYNNTLVIDHVDGNKRNNRLENLELVSPGENQTRAIKLGLKEIVRGEKHGNHKLTQNQVDEIRAIYLKGDITQKQLGEIYGVSRSCIKNIVNYHRWKI